MNSKIEEKQLKFDYLPSINYAMTANGRKCVENLELTNSSNADWQGVKALISGDMLVPAELFLERVPAGQTVSLTNIGIKPDVDKLRDLTESCDTTFTLKIEIGGEEAFSKDYSLRLLAFDEWPGVSLSPEIISAFVTPNVPELSRIKVAAAQFLEKYTGSSALDEYQTQDPNRVRKQVAAIYEALRSESLVYSAPPASYEQTGQRVRLADKVLSEKLGTCLDLSLLYASCMESCGLHPILVLQQGHMFVGCWLIDKYANQTVCDDISLLSIATADGINEMVLVEATDIAASDDVSFEDAVSHAQQHIVAEEKKFVFFCDIFRCRLEGIRPLPVRINGQWQTEGVEHSNATTEVKEQARVEIVGENADQQLTRQQIWERKLLDFSLRNNLLNLRLGKRVVPLISFNIDEMENHLQDGEDYQILPSPAVKKLSPDESGIYDSRLYQDELQNVAQENLKHNKISAYLTEEELKTALKGLFRSSRTAMEENGANSLFLVFGLLKWYETTKSTKPRYAPLMLLPVTMVRKGANNYVIRMREEEMTFNTTLVELLRQQYDINLSALNTLPTDEHGIDVLKVFTTVRAHLTEHPRWDIIEESLLGLFSFSKFVMWNDIHNNADKMRKNPIIESLIQKHWTGETPSADTDARQIDRQQKPSEFAIPVDVDSSQMEAVVESGEGHSFILYGPPGTGKSQTITNMIANALYHGRRVLFVAEKMAALQVVQKRLSKIGLAPFCLEMHSNKMTKTHLLSQLQGTLELTRIKEPEQYAAAAEQLYQQRLQLIGYMDKLHAKHTSGLSLYDCIARYNALTEDPITPPDAFLENVSDEKLKSVAESIKQLSTVFNITGHPAHHPLVGLSVTDPSLSTQDALKTQLTKLQGLIEQVMSVVGEMASKLHLNVPVDVSAAQWCQQLTEAVSALPLVNTDVLKIVADEAQLKQWNGVVTTGKALQEKRSAILKNWEAGVLTTNAEKLKNDWAEAKDKWFLPKLFAKNSVVKSLKAYNRSVKKDDIEPLITNLQAYQSLEKQLSPYLSEVSRIFGFYGQQGKQDWNTIEKVLNNSANVVGLLRRYATGIGSVSINKDELLSNDAGIATLRQWNSELEAMKSYATLDNIMLSEVREKLPVWLQNLDKTRDWTQWCQRRKELEANGLHETVNYLLSDEQHTAVNAANATLKGCYRKLAARIIDADKELQMFNGLLFEDQIIKYRELAKNFQELTKKMLYCKLAANIPTQALTPSAASELGILKRYIASGGRGATIRHIIDQIPTLLPKLCPVMLMSPISVAQFIDLDQEKFDIVCFDEASQMPTSEAVGAIARGKALICVGDPKQMPPTSFFSTNAVDDSEADIDDMESILDDCITLSLPARYLEWHYRSRHESLIAFSNQQYYDGKLNTFPSIDDRVSKVSFVPVDGTYDFGKTRSNRAEAEAIVKEVVRRLKDDELSKYSIGIVSFSKVQQNLIEDLLTEELAKHPDLEKKAYDGEEPIFVKNLENVQGDERDVILFSIGYGPDKSGKVSMNFGPLNNQGGERRLNVAVSRACREMVVFSTLQPEQIDLRRSNAKGVEGLKRFLEYAKNGRLAVASTQVQKTDDTQELVKSIANEMKKHGYNCDLAVGRSQFKIDLAVIDPDNADNYVMGILCDGRNYFETKTERDREICQPGVLKGLGWNLMRVWSVDWFMDKEAVMKRVLHQLDQLKHPEKAEKIETQAPAKTLGEGIKGNASAPKVQTNLPFSVTEDEIVGEIVNEHAVPYKAAELSTQHDGSIDHVARSKKSLANDVKKIIETEQPVAQSLIYKRIAKAWQLPRVTEQLKKLVDPCLANAYRDPASSAQNPYYWKSEADSQGYDKYREDGGRDIDDIPLVEIENATRYAVEQQISIPLEGLKKQASQMLGFSRKSQKVDTGIEIAVAQLIDKGILTESEGAITTVKDA